LVESPDLNGEARLGNLSAAIRGRGNASSAPVASVHMYGVDAPRVARKCATFSP
jgi:hypothetical protein